MERGVRYRPVPLDLLPERVGDHDAVRAAAGQQPACDVDAVPDDLDPAVRAGDVGDIADVPGHPQLDLRVAGPVQ